MAFTYTNPGWTNGGAPAINKTNLDNLSNSLASIGAGGGFSVILADNASQLAGALPAQYVAFRNKIINGDMRIDQRNEGATITPINAQYSVDGFAAGLTQASKFSLKRDSATAPTGYTYSLLATAAGAFTPAATDYFAVISHIEGYSCAALAWGGASAKAATLSFWAKSNLTGTFGGAIRNSAGNRNYPFSYTISVAGTWEYKTVAISGDTTGTWLVDNGKGLSIYWSLGAGATVSGAAGTWSGTSYVSATGATNILTATPGTLAISGVQFEIGAAATEFENRPYVTELALCQRYYEKSYSQGTALSSATAAGAIAFIGENTGGNYHTIPYKVTKRLGGAVTTFYSNNGAGASGKIYDLTGAADIAAATLAVGDSSCILQISATAGRNYQGQWACEAGL